MEQLPSNPSLAEPPPNQSQPEQKKYNLSTITGIPVNEIQLPDEVEVNANQTIEQMEKAGASKDELAELAWTTRLRLQSELEKKYLDTINKNNKNAKPLLKKS